MDPFLVTHGAMRVEIAQPGEGAPAAAPISEQFAPRSAPRAKRARAEADSASESTSEVAAPLSGGADFSLTVTSTDFPSEDSPQAVADRWDLAPATLLDPDESPLFLDPERFLTEFGTAKLASLDRAHASLGEGEAAHHLERLVQEEIHFQNAVNEYFANQFRRPLMNALEGHPDLRAADLRFQLQALRHGSVLLQTIMTYLPVAGAAVGAAYTAVATYPKFREGFLVLASDLAAMERSLRNFVSGRTERYRERTEKPRRALRRIVRVKSARSGTTAQAS